MTEAEELATNLRSVARDLWPSRPIEQMSFSDEAILLGVLVQRQLDMIAAGQEDLRSALGMRIKIIPPGNAEGIVTQPSARPKGRRGHCE